jgi:ketosteroid isomerase-like protein
MDRITDAAFSGDGDALGRLYAADAVAETPDAPRIEGAAAIVEYLMTFKRAFPDASFESMTQHESGDTAIDEGYLVGTHTDVLSTPDGDVPPTGKRLRIRERDVIDVQDGVAVAHRFYYDQLEFLSQLGLTDVGAPSVPQQRAAAPQRSKETTVR